MTAMMNIFVTAAETGGMEIIFPAAAAAAFILAILFLILYIRERRIRSAAERNASDKQNVVNREIERLNKETEVKHKEQFIQMRESLERENSEIRNELKNQERRLAKREDALDRKVEVMTKKEHQIDALEKKLLVRTQKIQEREAELDTVIREERERLQQIAGLSKEEAEKLLLERIEKEVSAEANALIQKISERTKEEAEKVARHVITTAIQRLAASHTSETVVSSIDIPNDEMKGRIIGREGRNIRAFEKATGVDVIVDDTPGVVVVSGFDAIRREVARRSMAKLITDGRIHPARIEEVVEQTQKEMEEIIHTTGKQVQEDMDIHDLHPKIVNLLGRLKFRTSYGQNALQHSLEVAHLCGMMAGELGLNVKLAKRCGLLHDIGKAVDHEIEGGHPEIGAGMAQRVRERAEVVNAIAAHHEDVPPESLYAVLTQAADAISASRPGARRETIDKYIKRLERLEAVATSFEGVKSAYAIQAGREIRVIVDQEKVDDGNALKLCRDIAKQIENELSYPGEVKVTLMRETRFVEYAR
jgi:ribonuclease Y